MSDIVRRAGGAVVRVAPPSIVRRGGHVGPVIWTTAEGERIPITKMETSHLFNAMKMTFNHIADAWGGEPVWFNHEYTDFQTAAITGPSRLARIVVAMLRELETRRDLPAHYVAPLKQIRGQVFPDRKQIAGR